jgi:hypothetical protein
MPSQPDLIPWDIYVDDRKAVDDSALGFLEVPNTASFLQKLRRCRQKPPDNFGRTYISREVHCNTPHLDSLLVVIGWIDCLFQHRCGRFFCVPWPLGQSKEFIVLKHLSRFCRRKRLNAPYNVVVFLDFDSDHAKARIQNTIQESGKIARCYHLNSLNNDCLQCADLLLGATSLLHNDPSVRADYQKLMDNFKLPGSQVKRLISGHLASKNRP